MLFKSFNINIKEILKKNFFLLYGENYALITELEKKITSELALQFRLIKKKYQEDYLIDNDELINQLIKTNNLFEEQEIIIISNATDKILNILDSGTINNYEKKIIFLSDILNKKSKLRDLAEKSPNFACIACYNDTPEQLRVILSQRLKEFKVSTSQELINSIFEKNFITRQDINDGLEKIQLLQKTTLINEEMLKNIFYSSAENDNFEIINYCLLGDKKNINKILTNIYFQGINFNEIIAALKYKINKLIDILKSNNKNLNTEQLINNYKPPIFWKEKNLVKAQLNRWNIKELQKLQNIIFETEIQCKKNYDISSTILQQFIITVSTKNFLENRLA